MPRQKASEAIVPPLDIPQLDSGKEIPATGATFDMETDTHTDLLIPQFCNDVVLPGFVHGLETGNSNATRVGRLGSRMTLPHRILQHLNPARTEILTAGISIKRQGCFPLAEDPQKRFCSL